MNDVCSFVFDFLFVICPISSFFFISLGRICVTVHVQREKLLYDTIEQEEHDH